MDLQKIRNDIDSIDREILRLINERLELGLRTTKFKEDIYDKQRENQILEQLTALSGAYGLIQPDFVEKLYHEILSESRKLQRASKTLIGFQGEHGAYGDVAARTYNNDLVPLPCRDFTDVFEGVEQGYLDLGIVPVENSSGGAVTQVNELLIKKNLRVVGAVKLRINHCLLELPESNWREIRIVYSHPQALLQCRNFLNRHKIEARPYFDTAGAAQMLTRERPKTSAVIASHLCAELYDLEVVKENIQDYKNNFTRFLVLAKKDQECLGNKCSLIFSTPHRAGTLFSVLEIFAEKGINLTRIESMPDRNDPGNYVFFLDFQRDDIHNQIESILETVGEKTAMLKYLGCYTEEVSE